jgi:uncharacterized tellurite resistance protein B-like protein
MTPIQNLHSVIGELAYATAFADGKIQKEELKKFEELVAEELRAGDVNFDITEIAFRLHEKDKRDVESVYSWAMTEINRNSLYLSPEMKSSFIKVMEKIAAAYPPVTIEEQKLIDRFKHDIEPITGDPVLYSGEPV